MRDYSFHSPYYEIKNLNTFINGAPGAIAFQRNLSVYLDEDALYQLCGFEVVPAPNISRISFVCKDGKMVVDKMNVYQSVDFAPENHGFHTTYKDAFKHMRVLYVSEDCLAEYDDISFYNQDCLQKITVERCGKRKHYSRGYPFIMYCDNLETVRIGKGIKHVKEITGNPKLSTVIFGSTLTYGDDVIDLTALTEEDLQDIIIFGDDVKTIEPLNRFSKPAESNSLSVVFNRDIRCDYGLNILPEATLDICIWLDASAPGDFRINYGSCDLLLVPQECLSYFQEKKPNYKYYKVESIEDKMSELGCVDLLSLLKMLSQETVNVE
jgi:hypothetical protein